ncbi:MAG: type II secretion system protein [Bacilli bacterium]|nr:type II secretion system protein [Bacilli bacterium]
MKLNNKKGFTLIELLAVIVILAVIALIATPIIMNVINDAKEGAEKDSAYGIVKALETEIAQSMVRDTTFVAPTECTINAAGNKCEYTVGTALSTTTEEIKIDYKGTKAAGGTIKFADGKGSVTENSTVKFGSKTYKLDSKGEFNLDTAS